MKKIEVKVNLKVRQVDDGNWKVTDDHGRVVITHDKDMAIKMMKVMIEADPWSVWEAQFSG